MNIATLLPFILIIGVMLLMTRSAKNKQRQAAQMREQMHPGTGVRTIGGLIAVVKEVRDTTVLLEVAPGVHSLYTKAAVGAVLGEEEYDRLVNHDVPLAFDEQAAAESAVEPADAEDRVDMSKPAADAEPQAAPAAAKGAADLKDTESVPEADTAADAKGDKDTDK